MKITPTPITAALAGAVAGLLMPLLWLRLADDSTTLVIAFLLVVALPAHAWVVGFGWNQVADARSVDTVLLKRVGAWLIAALVAAAVGRAVFA